MSLCVEYKYSSDELVIHVNMTSLQIYNNDLSIAKEN
jgi:hypothetical protein